MIGSLAALTDAPRWNAALRKSGPGGATGGGSYWKQGSAASIPVLGVTPATAGAGGTSYDRTTDGAIVIPPGALRLAALKLTADAAADYTIMLVDRLVACSGLALNTLTPQTVTLPSLPRSTDGKGVWAAIELYTVANNVASSHTIGYTNQDGTTSRVSGTLVDPFLTSTINNTNTTRIFPLAAGDYGVRTVSSYTVSAGTHSTAGDVGITLFRPISVFSLGPHTEFTGRLKPRDWLDTALADISDACLSLMIVAASSTGAAVLNKMNLEVVSAA